MFITTLLNLTEKTEKCAHRKLLSLGRAENGSLDRLLNSAKRLKTITTAKELIENISTPKTFIYGPLLILEKLFADLGINKVLNEVNEEHKQLRINLQKIIFTLVASRFVCPGSKLKVYEHGQNLFYPEMIPGDIELHQLYRAMDVLSQNKDKIEESLYWVDRDLFNYKVDIVLYDLTTLRFASRRTDLGTLRQFGYSKEKRFDLTQVVFGLLVDRRGIPLGFEVFPGNTYEGKTISVIMQKMRSKFNVNRFILVADRGLVSKENIKQLSADGGEFIIGMRLDYLTKEEREEACDIDQFQWVYHEELAIREVDYQIKEKKKGKSEDIGKSYRCILTWSKERAHRERKSRNALIEKIRVKLSSKKSKTKKFVSNKGYKKYVTIIEDDNRGPVLNEEQIAQDEKMDGFFAIITNVKDQCAKDILKDYKELWKIEDSFGEFKGTLRARPVFHWTDHRIVGHLTMCFLSYLCEAHLTHMLREKHIQLKSPAIGQGDVKVRPLTVVEAMKELKEVRAIPVEIGDQVVWTRTDIEGNASSLFKAMGMGLPPKLLKCVPKVAAHTEEAGGKEAGEALP